MKKNCYVGYHIGNAPLSRKEEEILRRSLLRPLDWMKRPVAMRMSIRGLCGVVVESSKVAPIQEGVSSVLSLSM